MRNKKNQYDYSSILRCFKLYEYIYESAKKELDANTQLVSYRTERLVIDYPDKFIKKHFPASYNCPDEDIREMLYGVLRRKRLSLLMWTDDNRGDAGKDTIHIIKPDRFSRRTSGEIELLLESFRQS